MTGKWTPAIRRRPMPAARSSTAGWKAHADTDRAGDVLDHNSTRVRVSVPRRRAVRACAEDLHRVRHVDVAVLRGDGLGPLFHGGALDLDGLAADAAHQVVVVVAAGAAAVDGLAVGGAQDVDLARVGEGLEGAVDGGQADRVAACA